MKNMSRRLITAFGICFGLSFAQAAICQTPRVPQRMDRGAISQPESHSKIVKSKARLPEINLDIDNDITWRDLFSEYSSALLGVYDPVPDKPFDAPDLDLAKKIGFTVDGKGQIVASDQTLWQVRDYSRDLVLTRMLNLYAEYLESAHSSREALLSDSMNAIFEQNELTYEQKIGIYLTFQNWLIEHATESRSEISVRKLRETERSMHRHWPDMSLAIECVEGDKTYRFSLDSVQSGALMNGGMYLTEEESPNLAELIDVDGLIAAAEAELNSADGTSNRAQAVEEAESIVHHAALAFQEDADPAELGCGVVPVQNRAMALNAYVSSALNDVVWALESKDADFVVDSMERLLAGLNSIKNEYGYIASWNEHWNHAPVSEWACELHAIELLLLEQDRYIDAIRLNRVMGQLFSGSTFYHRLTDHGLCETKLSGRFAEQYRRIWSSNADSFEWIIQQFSPKNEKKLDSAFQKWTRRGKAEILHGKRLLAFWTAWSNGDYERASRYAGDVVEKRTKIAHPQLHSLNIFMSAFRSEAWTEESIDTYIRVLRLKLPSLPYYALVEAAPYLDAKTRVLVAESMRKQDPSHAPHAAAEFFRTYEKELRQGMNDAHLAAIDAWLETELRGVESRLQSNRRRLDWLGDLLNASNWRELEKLSNLAHDNSPNEMWADFWTTVGVCVHSLLTGEKIENLPSMIIGKCTIPENLSPKDWLIKARKCVK